MIVEITRKVIKDFCIEFVKSPYLCYTEQGLHARFYCILYNAIPKGQRYINWEGKRICVIQKEYPMADPCGKSRRQNWDISIIQSPPLHLSGKTPTYDYLTLDSVVEFGLNETEEHLRDDANRIYHPNSNVNNKFIVHLFRISDRGSKITSRRDISPKYELIISPDQIAELTKNMDVEVYFGQVDSTNNLESGVWRIVENRISLLYDFK